MNFIQKSFLFVILASLVCSRDYTYFSQCDSRWGGIQLGWCTEYTICSAGCLISSVSMILNTFHRIDDPGDFNQWLMDNGGYVDGK